MTARKIRNLQLRVPTLEEYLSFDGAHCHGIYKTLSDDWACPGCRRSKFQILRWTMLFPKLPSRREGWAGGYHSHHDHGADEVLGSALENPRSAPRFAREVICEQCNAADAAAKRKLALPSRFSFSPSEIRTFVRPTAHGFHEVDYEMAHRMYQQVCLSGALYEA